MEKLIKQYQKQIASFDAQIESITKMIRENRTKSIQAFDQLFEDRKIIDAKRQQLFQVIKDLEDLV